MIVRNDEIIQLRNVPSLIHIASRKSFSGERKWRRITTQYGINQDFFSFNLHEIGRVSHPDKSILLRTELV